MTPGLARFGEGALMGRAVTVDEAALREALVLFAQQAIGHFDTGQVLEQLSGHAARVFDAFGSGVMLLEDADRLAYVTASDELVGQVDLMQASTGEGPCVTASGTLEVLTVQDLHADTRWPRFTAAATEAGLRAVACFPLLFDERCWGTFNVFHREPVDYDAEFVGTGRVLASAAAVLLHNAREYERGARVIDQLHQALRTRVVIEQAKGKIAAEQGIDPDEAFERLRNRARQQQRRIHDLAAAVLAGEAGVE